MIVQDGGGIAGKGKMKRVKTIAKTIIEFLLNPRFLLCFGLGWLITNGWSYILLALGTYLDIGWMITVATVYITFLWLPISPEKIVTVGIAMVLLRFLFPNDEKTLGILKRLHEKAKLKRSEKKQKTDLPQIPESKKKIS